MVHKANIFRKTHGLYREISKELSQSYPDIEYHDCYADALCALLVRHPQEYDVIVSENLIGDLLSDLAGQIAGGLGMTAGTNINYETKKGYFEPTHGCAPDIKGTKKANPIGQIRSAGLMLEFLGLLHQDERCQRAFSILERAITDYLTQSDPKDLPIELGGTANTERVGDIIVSKIR